MCKKRNDKESMIHWTPKPSQSFGPYSKQRKKFTEKELFKEKRKWRIEQKMKSRFFNSSQWQLTKTPRRQFESTLKNWKSMRKLWEQQLNKI